MSTTARFYSLADVSRELRTHRPRILRLVAMTGVILTPIGGALVMDADQFAIVKATHKRTPKGKPGRPRKVNSRPSESN